MSEVGVRCIWEVSAGLIPEQPDPEFTKRFVLTSVDPPEAFADRYNEAVTYVTSLTDPQYLNWVRMDWVWF